jgi:Uncharacterized protein conserved in bacteria
MNEKPKQTDQPRKHGSRITVFLIIILSVALAAAICFRVYLSVNDYLDYRKGLDVYADFDTLNDDVFPEYEPSDTDSQTEAESEVESDTAQTTTAVTEKPSETAVATTAQTEAVTTAAKIYTFADFINQLKWLDSSYKNFYCWLRIKNTVINYPVVQGDDNEYYLTHDIYGNRLSLGAIFADYRCKNIEDARNVVIYGHRAGYEIMFNDLADYFNQSFFDSNPYIYIYTPQYTYVYEVYAAYKSSMYSDFNRVYFNSDEDFLDHMNSFLKDAKFKRSVTLKSDDRILTLSTCTNFNQSERYVVQSRRVSRTAN